MMMGIMPCTMGALHVHTDNDVEQVDDEEILPNRHDITKPNSRHLKNLLLTSGTTTMMALCTVMNEK